MYHKIFVFRNLVSPSFWAVNLRNNFCVAKSYATHITFVFFEHAVILQKLQFKEYRQLPLS
jgi:hypothetical protein